MPKYRLTNTYIVEAKNKADAIAVIQQKGSELLAYIGLQEIPEPKPRSWKQLIKENLVG